jgi:glycosidase
MTDGQAWWRNAVFYHIHTLGFCGAPERNDFTSPAVPRLRAISEAAGHIRGLGAEALYLGPLFESTSHGYDTVDHCHVDRRLGDNGTLMQVIEQLHAAGLRVILDGVFNHTGRDHFAFHHLRQHGEASEYRSWFRDVDFGRENRFGDGFTYRGWEGHEELPELDLSRRAVRDHLLGAVRQMIESFGIDGLRLDVAYALPPDFIRELAELARGCREDFFLLGEMIHGDYRRFAADTGLDSLTNYETYKALWSSHNDGNYFELAHSLQRLSGPEGRCRDLSLYSFADNHDVPRIASMLKDPGHLFPLYTLLFTMPGIPSIYYGSEFGVEGIPEEHSDAPLRPPWSQLERQRPELTAFITELAGIRRRSAALRLGEYARLFVDHRTFVFERRFAGERTAVAVNSWGSEAVLDIPMPAGAARAEELFRPGRSLPVRGGVLRITLPPYGSGVWRLR